MLTLDATCAPANIRYPQDISLLNEAREKLETMIYHFVNAMVLSCQEDTVNVPEKSILHLLRAGSARQRKSAAHSADSLAT